MGSISRWDIWAYVGATEVMTETVCLIKGMTNWNSEE